jgi:hypothetical protein
MSEDSTPLSNHAAAMGRVGGKATGKAKARSRKKARHAALVRWGKREGKWEPKKKKNAGGTVPDDIRQPHAHDG